MRIIAARIFMIVKAVNDKKGIKRFVAFADMIYKGNDKYVPFMKKDLTKTLTRLVLKEKTYTALMVFGRDGAPKGRVLFTVDVNKQLPDKARCGYFFLFECVNEQEAANALLSEMNRRLAADGINYVEGTYWPFDRDNRRGILVKGFDSAPVIFTSYNPEYYAKLLENFGFKKHFDTITFKMVPNENQIERHKRVSRYAESRYDYRVDKMDPKNIDKDIKDVQQIMAEAATDIIYQDAPSVEEIRHIVKQWKSFLDPDFILIARTGTGRPVGVVMAIPDYFQVFKAMKGKTDLAAMFKYLKYRKKIDAVRAMLQFVVPDFQGKGVNVSLYTELLDSARRKNVRLIEAGTMMENNSHPIEALKAAGGELSKIYRIYFMFTGGGCS